MFNHALQLQPVIVTFREVFVEMGIFVGAAASTLFIANSVLKLKLVKCLTNKIHDALIVFVPQQRVQLKRTSQSRQIKKSFRNLHLSFEEIKEKSQQRRMIM